MTVLLRDLRTAAEMFEVWGGSCSGVNVNEEHVEVSKKMLADIEEMIAFLKRNAKDLRKKFGTGADFVVDVEVQQLLLNMDAISCFMAIQNALHDPSAGTPEPPVSDILKSCNELICWYVCDSPDNQKATFPYIAEFLDKVDDGVDCGLVAKAILRGNRSLIKQCPRHYFEIFTDKIRHSSTRRPEFLDVFVGLTETVISRTYHLPPTTHHPPNVGKCSASTLGLIPCSL